MSTIKIKKIGITKLLTDAIVNAANTGLIYNLPTYLEAHLAVHRVGRQAMNFRFAIFRSSYVHFPTYEW